MPRIHHIGILTGGGDCPGINAVIRAVVKTAVHVYGLRVTGFLDGFAGLMSGAARPLGFDDVSGMVALKGDRIERVPIRSAVAQPKLVDPAGERVGVARGLRTIFGDEV